MLFVLPVVSDFKAMEPLPLSVLIAAMRRLEGAPNVATRALNTNA